MTPPRSLTDDERREFVRYTRTRSWPMLGRFPVDDDLHAELLAQMLGGTPEAVGSLLRQFEDEARAAAESMLADPAYREAVTTLPFRTEDRVVAVGDSVTADRLGWFELLSASVGLAGGAGPTLINLGVSGNTTADVIERFDLLEAARPSSVLLMLGTNDARAHGRTARHRMVTADETERNLRVLVDLITGDLNATVTVITPPAVDQSRVDAFFRDAPVHWEAAAVAEVADVVLKAAHEALDLHRITGRHTHEDLLEADGVHPNSAGQRFILTHVLRHLHGRGRLGPPGHLGADHTTG
ncbi:SGNH/GDSL hydrolase family protein [Actinoplanes solisilvae]|uniref:SGNH/GDSL hydrolase family protein n=1 Tax=Actinoplanes solisilvae TaxID=2486853 RepID=UPI000FDB2456|nr:GDSL-type esterase/lipase family protein [Actinoplanes solisilvae]